jgi:NAD(P)-dependent dehydrogenase (short-subunit alcohol dehydrogenase family)
LNYVQNAHSATELGRHIVSSGGRAKAIPADISREDEILRLFVAAACELGPLAGLVNNASITPGVSALRSRYEPNAHTSVRPECDRLLHYRSDSRG